MKLEISRSIRNSSWSSFVLSRHSWHLPTPRRKMCRIVEKRAMVPESQAEKSRKPWKAPFWSPFEKLFPILYGIEIGTGGLTSTDWKTWRNISKLAKKPPPGYPRYKQVTSHRFFPTTYPGVRRVHRRTSAAFLKLVRAVRTQAHNWIHILKQHWYPQAWSQTGEWQRWDNIIMSDLGVWALRLSSHVEKTFMSSVTMYFLIRGTTEGSGT